MKYILNNNKQLRVDKNWYSTFEIPKEDVEDFT